MSSVLITGDRNYTDRKEVRRVLKKLWKQGYTVLVHGAADGADTLAGQEGDRIGFDVHPHPANWLAFGRRSAGPIRNRSMLTHEEPDLIVWFHDDIEKSKGTKDMIKVATMKGYPVKRHTEV